MNRIGLPVRRLIQVDGYNTHHIAELNLLPLATWQTMAERAAVHAPYLVRRASGSMRRSGRITPAPARIRTLPRDRPCLEPNLK